MYTSNEFKLACRNVTHMINENKRTFNSITIWKPKTKVLELTLKPQIN